MGLAAVIAGSATSPPAYRGNDLARELGPGHVRTLGCIDVGLKVEERPKGEHLELLLGNRCAHPEAIDMRRARITGYDFEGNALDVALSDPRGEIEELHLGAAERAREIIRLERARRLKKICFDLKKVAPDADDARPDPLCLVRKVYTFDAEGS